MLKRQMDKQSLISHMFENTELKAKNFLRPLTKDQICKGSDEVGKVLDHIDTVHGALIAFNEDNDFIGVLSSYKTLYKNHTPPGKKVMHAVIQPMVITKETSLAEIARCMASDKVYLLPVFANDKVIGTISAVDMVKRMFHDENLRMAVAEELEIDPPMMVDIKAKVKDAYSLLRANGVSEVIVTDKLGRISGAVTRSDIKHAFIHPTDKQRFHHDNYRAASSSAYRPDDVSFDSEKKRRENEAISGYISTSMPPTIEQSATNKEIILALLENEQQYLVINDKAAKPVGIVSYRNILEAMACINSVDEINIIYEKPSKNVLPSEFNSAVNDLNEYAQKLNKRLPVERVELRIQEPKYVTGKTAEYDITLQIDPYSGGLYIAHAKAKSYRQSLHIAMKQMDKQLEKGTEQNKKHRKKSLAQASVEPLKQLFH